MKSSAIDLRLKRAYEPAAEDDGCRILVERLWPRGVSKEAARLDLWLREVAPSTELRRWFGHDPEKWTEFQVRYRAELDGRPEVIAELCERLAAGRVTLVYATRGPLHSAGLLAAYLEAVLG